MKLSEYIKQLQDFVESNPEFAEREVWSFADDEGNSIQPCLEGVTICYVGSEECYETDGYVVGDYLNDYLEDYDMTIEDFLKENKQIVVV